MIILILFKKKIRIPYEGISKKTFGEQVLMAFANDNLKNDVSIYDDKLPLRPSSLSTVTQPYPYKKRLGRKPGSLNKPKIYGTLVTDSLANPIIENLKGPPSIDDLQNPPENPVKTPIKKRLRRKKDQTGNGINSLVFKDRVIKHKKVFNNKYAIDTKKFKKNILDLKYLKNANHVATFQPIEISSYLKNIIENIIKDNYNIQKEEFIHLNNTEKRILKRLFYFLKIKNDDVMDYDYNIQKRFEVAYGSFLAGNTNKELIQELKDYVKLALHESTINKTDGQLILKELNNSK